MKVEPDLYWIKGGGSCPYKALKGVQLIDEWWVVLYQYLARAIYRNEQRGFSET